MAEDLPPLYAVDFTESERDRLGGEGAHRSLAEGLQHRLPAQLVGVPTPGPGVAPPLSARFGYASSSGQGRSLGRSTLVIDTGSIHGGRSIARDLWRLAERLGGKR